MIGVVVCTHHTLAEALIETVQLIVGEFPNIESVGAAPADGPEGLLERIGAAIAKVDSGEGVVVLCDMFGGTPSNLSLSFLGDKVEIITGVNLPMLLKIFSHRDGPLETVANTARDHGKESIRVAGALLRPRGES